MLPGACSIAPFATAERRRRRVADRRIVEAAAALKQCFETVIEGQLYPRSAIHIHIKVLQSDGGSLAGWSPLATLAESGGLIGFSCRGAWTALRFPRMNVAYPSSSLVRSIDVWSWRHFGAARSLTLVCLALRPCARCHLTAAAAAINAGTLALIDAGVAMRDFVVGCSIAYVARTPLLDPNYLEASAGGPELTVAVLPQTNAVTLATMDARMLLDAFDVSCLLFILGGGHFVVMKGVFFLCIAHSPVSLLFFPTLCKCQLYAEHFGPQSLWMQTSP